MLKKILIIVIGGVILWMIIPQSPEQGNKTVTLSGSPSFYIDNVERLEITNNTSLPRQEEKINTRYDSRDSVAYPNPLPFDFSKSFTELRTASSSIKFPNVGYNIFDIKVILPTNQELFVERAFFDESQIVGYMNSNFTSAFINHKYRIERELLAKDICFIHSFPNGLSGWSDMIIGQKFIDSPTSCYEIAFGEKRLEDLILEVIINSE